MIRKCPTGAEPQRDGSAAVVVVVVGALCALAVSGLVLVGRDALDASRAQTVADGAALAGVIGGPGAAMRVVDAAGASLISQSRTGSDFDVVVSVGQAVAQARARREQAVVGIGDRAGLAPAMLAALARADDLVGKQIPVVSGYRSRATQAILWADRARNPYPVARPGTSRHELGLAVDVPLGIVGELSGVAALAGLCHPLPESDPVHFIVCRTHP